MDISRKWEDEIDEQRSDVSAGLDLPIYELNFTNRWAFSFLGRGRFNEGPQCVLFRECFPAQVLNHGTQFERYSPECSPNNKVEVCNQWVVYL